MKRVVSYLLIVSMLFSLVGTGVCNVAKEEAKAASSYTVTEEDFTYCYITFNDSEEEYIGISSYIGNDTDVVIPDKIEGCTVISIEQSAFEGCDKIKSIVLPDSITTIEEWAFYGCSSLQKINIPEGVVGIGAHAFRNCKELKEIHLPDSIQYIDEEAFLSTGLLQIDIPEGVEKIDCDAFANTKISEVIFKRPDVLIADCAFRCYGEEGYTTNIKVIGIKDSSAEVFARHVSAVFESIDGKYKKDYGIQNYCYDTAVANYEATIEFLDEYYIQKYPNLALEPLYGGEKEHKMFREIAENIVAKDIKHTEPETLYNWMNENILLNGQYGYPLDVYNFKSADCYGNATLLCELLRSIDIPAVVVTGYTGNTVSVLTEKMLEDEEVTKHAWVLTYYEGTWQLLDSAMDRMINDKQEICKWYYTNDIDDGLAIYSDLFNPNVNDGSPCFKDGEFFIYSEGCLLGRNTGYSEVIDPEWVFRVWEDFNLSGSGARYVDDNSEIKMEFNKGGWINNGGGVRYFKNNMSVLCHYVMDIDGVTYAIGQNGEMFDISSLNGNYRIKYGYPIIDVGTTFQPQPAIIGEIETIEWSSSNSNVITIDENGVFTAVGTGCAYVDCDVVTTEGSRRHFMLEIGVDNFITELSIPKNMTMKVGEKNKLKPTTNNTSMMFGHFSWESSNEEVATVDINGNVTAHKKGTAIITVVYGDGSGIKDTCKVTVGKETSESDKVVETKKPVVSQKPAKTQAPTKTQAPEIITKKPEVTVTPEILETMKPTLTPVTLHPTKVPEFEKKSKPQRVDTEKIINKQEFQQCYFKDIDRTESNSVEIIVNEGIVLTKDMFTKAKEKKKDIEIGVCDADGNLKYSWHFEGNSIKNADVDMDITITVDDSRQTEINEVCQVKENAVYMSFSHHGNLPSPARIKMYVGDKYKDGEGVYLYYYDEEKKQVLLVEGKELIVANGYVEYTITHCSIYFLYDEMIENVKLENKESILSNEEGVAEEKNNTSTGSDEKENNVIGIVVVVCIAIIIIGTVICIRIKWRKNLR